MEHVDRLARSLTVLNGEDERAENSSIEGF